MQPGQQKITQFDEVTSTQAGDVIPIVRGGQNKKISVENFTGVLPDGWLTPAETWTFASFGNGVGVITVPEGNINRYPNGTRVWFKQGTPTPTNRYGLVIASTTTSITVAMVNSTTLQNLTIQTPVISGETAPRTPENIDWSVLPAVLSNQIATYTIPARAMTAWTPYSNGSNSFYMIAGRRYRISVAAGSVPGTTSAEHVLSLTPGSTLSSLYSQGGNIKFTGEILHDATSTGMTAFTLQNRVSASFTGTTQPIVLSVQLVP